MWLLDRRRCAVRRLYEDDAGNHTFQQFHSQVPRLLELPELPRMQRQRLVRRVELRGEQKPREGFADSFMDRWPRRRLIKKWRTTFR